MELEEILSNFKIKGNSLISQPYGNGHIHSSYKVKANGEAYLLQRINTHVFPNVPVVMENIERVLDHFKHKNVPIFDLIPTRSGGTFYTHHDASTWRLFSFVENSHALDIVENEKQANAIGKGFGDFILQLSDLNPDDFHITLPLFHSISYRLDLLKQAKSGANEERLDRSGNLFREIELIQDDMLQLDQLAEKVPVRITHNDTKCNNVLLDGNGNALCVIDLDTVMPGIVHYDFGDALRTVACSAPEDETDLSKVIVNQSLYAEFTEGFLGNLEHHLTKAELDSLHIAPTCMAFIMGVRFLTDYLNNDRYYNTTHDDHNYDRAANQLHLAHCFSETRF